MMKSALIGYTGFVGSNIAKQASFTDGYNSKNIEDIKGKKYDLIISAGTKGEMWKANQDPERDWKGIKRLLDCLKDAQAGHFILISTIAVYPNFEGVDEDTPIKLSQLKLPYGKNRFRMEEFIKKNFKKNTIIRFPQLYGPGLKKNFVYDLIHDNALDFTHKDTLFQWYNLKNIWKDIQITIKNKISLINFAVEPIRAKELAKYALNMNFDNVPEKPPHIFNFQTKYAKLYGGKGTYIYHRHETLKELKDFISSRKRQAQHSMKTALIGYTGFVGSNLKDQFAFSDGYNSKNIEDIKGKKYDLVVSAGAKADRNEANNNPEEDWNGIKRLLDCLSETSTKHLVLISTIDVYPDKNGVDEDTPISLKDLTEAYGRNKYRMELFINKNFQKNTIVRLPNLIGENLKKNFIFDLIHNTGLELRHKDSLLQYYNLKNLWKDIQMAVKHKLNLVNFAVEPITSHDIALSTLGIDFQNVTDTPPFQFDFRTKHGKLYGSNDGYLYHREEILNDLKKFINKERKHLSRATKGAEG